MSKRVVILAILGFLTATGCWYFFAHQRSAIIRVAHPSTLSVCMSNLGSIGQAILEYAREHGGNAPASFEVLLISGKVDAHMLVCGKTNDTIARGPTTQRVIQELAKPGHLSYVYAAQGMKLPLNPDAVLAYEPLTNHGFRIGVVYADGRVDSIVEPAARMFIAELQAGHNPPRPEMLK